MKCPYCKPKVIMKRTKLKLKDYIWFTCPKCKHFSTKPERKSYNKMNDCIYLARLELKREGILNKLTHKKYADELIKRACKIRDFLINQKKVKKDLTK